MCTRMELRLSGVVVYVYPLHDLMAVVRTLDKKSAPQYSVVNCEHNVQLI